MVWPPSVAVAVGQGAKGSVLHVWMLLLPPHPLLCTAVALKKKTVYFPDDAGRRKRTGETQAR